MRTRAGDGSLATSAAALLLHGRTGERPVRAKDTAIARLWTEDPFATCTLIEELTRVRRHDVLFGQATLGAGNDRFPRDVARSSAPLCTADGKARIRCCLHQALEARGTKAVSLPGSNGCTRQDRRAEHRTQFHVAALRRVQPCGFSLSLSFLSSRLVSGLDSGLGGTAGTG